MAKPFAWRCVWLPLDTFLSFWWFASSIGLVTSRSLAQSLALEVPFSQREVSMAGQKNPKGCLFGNDNTPVVFLNGKKWLFMEQPVDPPSSEKKHPHIHQQGLAIGRAIP